MAQTPEQRRRNAKFQKEQDARRGKSQEELKLRDKEVQKLPISLLWLAVLTFVIFGGIIFEVLSRFLR